MFKNYANHLKYCKDKTYVPPLHFHPNPNTLTSIEAISDQNENYQNVNVSERAHLLSLPDVLLAQR